MLRRWAPLAAAASVVAIAVAVATVFGHAGSAGPPVLRLASGTGTDVGAAADAPLAAGARSAASGAFELLGSLPSGPDEARAHPLPAGAATADDVRRLAAALSISEEPKRVEGGWQAGALRVRDDAGNPWYMYAGCAPDVPVSSDGSVSPEGTVSSDGASVASCAIASGWAVAPGAVSGSGGSSGSSGAGVVVAPAPAPASAPPAAAAPTSTCPANARCAKPPVSIATLPPVPSPVPTIDVDAARSAAKRVLGDLGLGDADVSVQGGGEHAFVQAAPRVDGLRTSGFDTSLEIDADGKVFSGNGFLGRPGGGAMYPLISAKAAYDALPAPPRPMMLCPANADCPQPAPQKITHVELGLMLTPLADEHAALLPAWLFTVDDWPMPLAQPAIEPRFLELPKPVQVDPGKGEPVPPAEPPMSTEPTGPRATFGFDAAFPTDEPNVVIVQYGDSGSCPHQNVTPLVKESADSVVVTLEADAQPTMQACTDDYRQQLVTLKLDAPLGDRKVLDGSRGEPVAVDRSCARPMGQPSPPKTCKN